MIAGKAGGARSGHLTGVLSSQMGGAASPAWPAKMLSPDWLAGGAGRCRWPRVSAPQASPAACGAGRPARGSAPCTAPAGRRGVGWGWGCSRKRCRGSGGSRGTRGTRRQLTQDRQVPVSVEGHNRGILSLANHSQPVKQSHRCRLWCSAGTRAALVRLGQHQSGTTTASGAPVASAVLDPADGAAAATLSGLLSPCCAG